MPKDAGPGTEALVELGVRVRAEPADALQLIVEDLHQNLVCSVSVDESIPCITVVWKRYVTSSQLRFVHESLLELMRCTGISKVLGDDACMPLIHGDDLEWILGDWMPRAIAAGFRAGASRLPLSVFGRVDVLRVQTDAPSGVLFRSFDSLSDAREWLRTVACTSTPAD